MGLIMNLQNKKDDPKQTNSLEKDFIYWSKQKQSFSNVIKRKKDTCMCVYLNFQGHKA